MSTKRWVLAVTLAGAGTVILLEAVGGEFGPHRAKTRPGCLDGIPAGDYQYRPRSPSSVAISRRAYLLAATVADTQEFVAREAELRARAEAEALQREREAAAAKTPRNDAERRPLEAGEILPPPRELSPGEASPGEELSPGTREPDEGTEGPRLEGPLLDRLRREGTRIGPVAHRVFAPDRGQKHLEPIAPGIPVPQNMPRKVPTRTAPEKSAEPLVTRLYQLDRSTLKVDHCEVSQVALQVRSDGSWVLSMRADQNRTPGELDVAQYNPKLHLKRNEFQVRLRCLGGFAIPPMLGSPNAGQPVLAAIEPKAFWVENGQPRYIRLVGCNPDLKRDFELVDRIEFEFFYR